MDRRIETLVRRDPNGRPLPPSQAEIANWSANYGPNKAQAAVKEIQDIQDKARAQEQAAGESALKAEQARAAIEATKAQAALAKQKADVESAAQAQETEKKRLANEEITNKQNAQKEYLKSTTGQIMQGSQAPAAIAGGVGGYLGSQAIAHLQDKSVQNANEKRQQAAADFEKINPATATPAEYQSVHTGARQAGLVPSAGPLSSVQRGVRRYLPYVGAAGAFGVEGALMRYLANQEDGESLKKDIMNDFGTLGFGLGAGALGKGAAYALYPPTHPDASALAKIELARLKAKEGATGEAREALPPPAPPVEPYKGNPKDVARYIAHDLGLTPNGKDTKTDLITNALGQIRSGNATPEQIDLVTQRARGIDPETILGRIAKSNKPLAALLAATGISAAAAVGTPSKAQAAIPPAEHKAPPKPQPEETSTDLSDLEREYGTGLPKGTAREALKGAADTAISAAPVVGEARMAAEAPNLYKPSDEDLADAEYWQHGREDMANHLPEHEKAHIDNPQAAHSKAAWMIPYLRAGAEAQKRGEDFFGGSDQYERELGALKHFYHGPQAPTAPESETAPAAPEGFAKGGSVNRKNNPHLKQINSIHDTFKHKLGGQREADFLP